MKSFFLSFIVALIATSCCCSIFVLAQQQQKTNLGTPLIISDLSDGDAYSTSTPYDSNRPASWSSTFQTAINNFISNGGLSGASVTFNAPKIIDSKGSFLTAVIAVNDYLSSSSASSLPPFIVIADSSVVTDELIIAIRSKIGPDFANIPVFISSTASDWATRSSNIILLNGNNDNVAANFVDLLHGLGQSSLCLLVDEDMDGLLFERSLERDLARRTKGSPILLKTARVSSGSRAMKSGDIIASENAAIKKLASEPNPCTAVLVAGEGNIAARVLSARQRGAQLLDSTAAGALSKMFFYFAPMTVFRFPNNIASASPAITNQVLLTATNFKTVSDLASQLSLSTEAVKDLTDAWAIAISPVLDAISLAAVAASNADSPQTNGFLNAIFTQTLQGGATTPFKISSSTQARSKSDNRARLVLVGSTTGASNSVSTQTVAQWTGAAQHSSPIIVNLPNTIPRQTAEPFVVCLVGQQACPTLSALNHAYFTLLASAPNVLPSSTGIFVKSISAGEAGLTTIANLAAAAPNCDFVIGPGSSATARNLFPFFNYHNIPMIDFSSTDSTLSSRISFSTYARVNPTDEYISKVAGSTFKNFGWESVAIVTSLDTYGEQIVSSYTKGLAATKVSVEISMMIPANQLSNNDTVYRTLSRVKDELITRVIILAISSNDEAHALFYKNIVDLGMTDTQIFWLSDSMCQYAAMNPTARYPLQNSMCASPQYDVNAYRQQYLQLFNSDEGQAQALFQSGGFDTSQCDLKSSDMYAPFASDAALTILDVIKRLGTSAGHNKEAMAKAQHNLTRLMDLVHSTHVMGITGIVAFDPVTGERTNAAYTVDMQQPNNQVVKFAQWNSGTGYTAVDLPTPLQWFANGTDVPRYTTRDIKFIVVTTVTRNTASVVFSIIGFIVTVSIFCFCYKHYKLQKMVAGVQEQQQQQQQSQQPQQQDGASVEMSGQTQQNHQTPQNQQQQQYYQGNSTNVEMRSQNNGW